MNLLKIQSALKEENTADGWLFFDFHHRDPVGGRVLGLDPSTICKRRWFYFIPKSGAPRKLVHAIEAFVLDSLPGGKVTYRGHEELREKLREMLSGGLEARDPRGRLEAGGPRVAMQYSPMNNIPMVSLADAGTVELIRSL